MDLTFYKQTDLERWINKQLQDNGIHYASDMDMDRIAGIFKVDVHLWQGKCTVDWRDNENGFCDAIILLNAYMTEEQRRERFFHELAHPLLHVGIQDKLPKLFKDLQETQSSHFQLHAAMPVYMLEEFKGISSRQTYIKVISEEFRLPVPFVEKRIDQVERRINQGRADQEFLERLRPKKRASPPLSEETHRIMDKLQLLQAKKGVV